MSLAARAVLVDWPLLVCTIAIFGTSAFVAAVAPGADSHGGEIALRVTKLVRWLAAIYLVLAPFWIVNATASMANVSWRAAIPLLPQVIHLTHAGRMWMWRLGADVVLLIFAWLPGAVGRRLHAVCLTASVMLVLRAMAGHAIDKGALDVAIYFLHLLAVGIWFGALAGLCLGWMQRPLPIRWFLCAVPRVSRVAGWCVLVIVMAGGFMAYEALGWNSDHLLYAAYGRTLIAKLALVAIVLAVGGYNRYFLVEAAVEPGSLRALMRNVAVEVVLLLAILAWSVVLASTPPPA